MTIGFDGPSDYESTMRISPQGYFYHSIRFIPRIRPLPAGVRLEELSVVHERLSHDPKTLRTRYVVKERAP